MKTILSLFDFSGNWSKPYRENNFNVVQVDIKLGTDILKFNYKEIKDVYGILCAVPCTDYALSGARWFYKKDNDGSTKYSNSLVSKTKEIIEYFNPVFYCIENPKSRIHKINTWMGKPLLKFHPYEYALYDQNPELSRYKKTTWLWGKFNIPDKKSLEPFMNYFPGWKNLGGKSDRTKELRSITPMGFSYAFYEYNH